MNNCSGQPNKSIWQGVPRRNFEDHIDQLARKTKYVPGARDYTLERQAEFFNSSDSNFLLEQKLADDFAYISAYDVGAGYVTVATIRLSDGGPSILTLAANEGVQLCVKEAILKILGNMEQHSAKALRGQQCEQSIFDTIVSLDRNKIYSRLWTKQYNIPKFCTTVQSALHLGLEDFMKKLSEIFRKTDVRLIELLQDVSQFRLCCIRLQRSDERDPINETKETIKVAYQLRRGANAFYTRLVRMQVPQAWCNARVIRDVDKLGDYWRIARDLTRVSRQRRHHPSTNRIALEEVPHCKSISRSSTASINTARYVHAEVQMIMYYEAQPLLKWPRWIGASKKACFLCDAFIEAHGRFKVSKAHRQVTNKWTVPEMQGLSREATQRISEALERVNKLVCQAIPEAGAQAGYRPFPPQSSINVHMLALPSPTESTVMTISQEATTSIVSISTRLDKTSLVGQSSNSFTPTQSLVESLIEKLDEPEDIGQSREQTEVSTISSAEHASSAIHPPAIEVEDFEVRCLVQETPTSEADACAVSGSTTPRSYLPLEDPGTVFLDEPLVPLSPKPEVLDVIQDLSRSHRHDSLMPHVNDNNMSPAPGHATPQGCETSKQQHTDEQARPMDSMSGEHVATVTSGGSDMLSIGQYHLNIHLEDSDPFDGPYTSASVRATIVGRGAANEPTDVISLALGDCEVIDIGDGSGEKEAHFALQAGHHETVRVSCSWAR